MEGEIVKVLIENNKIKEAIPINIKINELFQPEIENK
jgi:DNA-binding XRE family transcriptional regulator